MVHVPAADILYIDDNAENIAAASLAGLKTIRYTDADSAIEQCRMYV